MRSTSSWLRLGATGPRCPVEFGELTQKLQPSAYVFVVRLTNSGRLQVRDQIPHPTDRCATIRFCLACTTV